MLAAVKWRAVLMGMGVGILVVAAFALIFWLLLSGSNTEDRLLASTILGTVSGFGIAGWVAGRNAPFSPWFHGALSALAVTLIVVVVAVRGGSTAPGTSTLILAVMAIVLGGTGGAIGGRRAGPDIGDAGP